jgi:hypothetical protein
LKVVERLRAARPDEDIRAMFFGYRADRKTREAILAASANGASHQIWRS